MNLVDQNGKAFVAGGPSDLVTVYDFIFTRCAGTCPLMSRELSKLTKEMKGDDGVRFVSISVDPDYDQPTVLREYKSHYANDSRWSLLTGDRQTILDLSVRGFMLAAGEAPPGADEPIVHSTKFILVDRTGQIRGYYDLYRKEEMMKLANDARALESR